MHASTISCGVILVSPDHIAYNAKDERAFFCVLDPFVIAPLFFSFCAINTGSSHVFYALFVLSFALSQTQQFCSPFLLRTGPLRVVTLCLRVFMRGHFIVFNYYYLSALWRRFAAHAPLSAITITIRNVVFSDHLKNYSIKQNIRKDKKPIKTAAKICGISPFVVIRTKSEYSHYMGNLSGHCF